MRKIKALIVSACLGFALVGWAPAAGAQTCMIDNGEVEAVVCAVHGSAGMFVSAVCKALKQYPCLG